MIEGIFFANTGKHERKLHYDEPQEEVGTERDLLLVKVDLLALTTPY